MVNYISYAFYSLVDGEWHKFIMTRRTDRLTTSLASLDRARLGIKPSNASNKTLFYFRSRL